MDSMVAVVAGGVCTLDLDDSSERAAEDIFALYCVAE